MNDRIPPLRPRSESALVSGQARARAALRRLAALHTEMADIYRELAETDEIQLDGSAGSLLMDGATMPSSPGTTPTPTPTTPGTPPGTTPLLTVANLAELLAIDARTVRRWRDEKRLPPAIAVGGIVRWRREDVERWLDERREGTG